MANVLVIVSYRIFPTHMGGQKAVALLCRHLQAYHHIELAVSVDNASPVEVFPVRKMLFNNKRIARNICRINALRKIVQQNKIDCIIAEHSYTGWIAWLLRKITGTPFIIHSHNNEASRFRQMGKRNWMLYSSYEKWIHQKANFNFFITEEDLTTANRHYLLDPLKSAVIPYGIEENKIIDNAKERLAESFGVSASYLLYFNGTLDYAPNSEAVEMIIKEINPRLMQRGIDFKIIISGKRLLSSFQQQVERMSTICFLGFAPDTTLLYQACTLFINPVTNNSGIKTKVVEALSQHCTVVSTRSGATGIPNYLCADKLFVSEDRHWDGFVDNIMNCLHMPPRETPVAFFNYFQWEKVAAKAALHIDNIVKNA